MDDNEINRIVNFVLRTMHSNCDVAMAMRDLLDCLVMADMTDEEVEDYEPRRELRDGSREVIKRIINKLKEQNGVWDT